MKDISVVVLALVLIGCEGPSYFSDHVDIADVPGIYYANFGEPKHDFIDLKSDYSYVHYHISTDSQLYTDSGSWELITHRDEMYSIRFSSFVRRHPQKGGCYYTGPLAAIDSMPINVGFSYYRNGRRYVITYCFSQLQYYDRTEPRGESKK